MGDLSLDTAVEAFGDGRYRATLSADWNLWGPVGGYLASIALRAAGADTAMAQPASLSCHYLSTAHFDGVDLEVTKLRTTRRAESLRVRMTQDRRPVLEGLVWAVAAGLDGPERSWIDCGALPRPEDVKVFGAETEIDDLVASATYWRNVEIRKIGLDGGDGGHGGQGSGGSGGHEGSGGARGEAEPRLRSWERYRPRATFDDPWIDACREVISIDVSIFPSAASALPGLAFVAPSMDLYVAFHTPAPTQEYFLVESQAVAAGSGLVGGQARIWSRDGVLAASGNSQLLCRLF